MRPTKEQGGERERERRVSGRGLERKSQLRNGKDKMDE
jgi:hypothetical protein